jgi:hypothetical protein
MQCNLSCINAKLRYVFCLFCYLHGGADDECTRATCALNLHYLAGVSLLAVCLSDGGACTLVSWY